MGPVVGARALTHRLPTEAQTLWVTGSLGDANLAALRQTPTPAFELRMREAAMIRAHATACIDTSGGLMDAVWILHEMNPGLRFEVRADRIPLAAGLCDFSRQAGLPAGAALLGGAGEYELLFATPQDLPKAVADDFQSLGITPLGDVTAAGGAGVHICRGDGTVVAMGGPPPCPRAAATTAEHVKAVVAMAADLFG
jgi:thiamine-monophosphate kinase